MEVRSFLDHLVNMVHVFDHCRAVATGFRVIREGLCFIFGCRSALLRQTEVLNSGLEPLASKRHFGILRQR